MQTISPEQLKSRLDDGEKPVLLDVREAWEFEICKIPGSLNLSMSKISEMLDRLDADEETIVICHHGMRSFQVASYLEQNGFKEIVNLEGGIDAWAKTIDTNMAQY